jgi:hypothetical protein
VSCLAPCPACNRHVSSDETACPFCSAALPDSFGCQPRPRPRGRLSRAALVAAGAALLGGEACSAPAPLYGPAPPIDAGADTSTMDTGTMDGGPVALYGAAPPAFEQAPAETDTAPPPKNKT